MEPPSLNQAVRLVASLGGVLTRKGDGEPDTQSLWLDLDAIAFSWALRVADTPGLTTPGRSRKSTVSGNPE